MRPHQLLLAVALLITGWLALFGDKTPNSSIVEPNVHRAVPVSTPLRTVMPEPKVHAVRTPVILALQSRDTLIGGAHPSPDGAALFGSQSWAPPPPPPSKPAPPPPPTAPPLPFTYIGKKLEDQVWEVYLVHGDQTYVAREHSILDGTYRVDAIQPPTLSLTYMPLNQVQPLSIGGAE